MRDLDDDGPDWLAAIQPPPPLPPGVVDVRLRGGTVPTVIRCEVGSALHARALRAQAHDERRIRERQARR